jgi:hypothetical protein
MVLASRPETDPRKTNMSMKSILRGVLAAAALALVCSSTTPTAAQAAPNCGQVPLPPACTGSPTPPPTPSLGDFSSEPFTPDWTRTNYFNVAVWNVPASAVAGLSDGDVTRFHGSISCTNGVYISSALAYVEGRTPGLFFTAGADTRFGPGSCVATVWDKSTLRVSGATVHQSIGSIGSGSWSIVFD